MGDSVGFKAGDQYICVEGYQGFTIGHTYAINQGGYIVDDDGDERRDITHNGYIINRCFKKAVWVGTDLWRAINNEE